MASPATAQRPSLRELAVFFLRLGTTAFGGPAGHIALMEDELVRRRQWLSREKFLDLLGASSLIPGPSSSELAIHIGYLLGRWPGLLVAGICFILPAACIMSALAWAYLRYGNLPGTAALLYGIKPVVIALIVQALCGLGRGAVKTPWLAAVAVASLVAAALGLQPLLLLLLAGVIAALAELFRHPPQGAAAAALLPPPMWRAAPLPAAAAAALAAPVSLGSLFLVFLKLGAVVFGSGYVLLAFLHADLVVHRGWLTDSQLVDAVALGQVTPGPVFTTATFIGYLLAGGKGAAAATIAIFLPAFFLVAASGPLIPLLRKSRLAGAFLDGVVVASLALMAAVGWQLARASIVDPLTAIVAAAALLLLLRLRVNSAWLVLAGAAAGLAAHALAIR